MIYYERTFRVNIHWVRCNCATG